MKRIDKVRSISNTWVSGIALVLSLLAIFGLVGSYFYAEVMFDFVFESMMDDISRLEEVVEKQGEELKVLKVLLEERN